MSESVELMESIILCDKCRQMLFENKTQDCLLFGCVHADTSLRASLAEKDREIATLKGEIERLKADKEVLGS